MSVDVSTRIMGVIPKNEEYEKMLKVFDVCREAEIKCPEEVVDFFQLEDFCGDYIPPHDGMEVDLCDTDIVERTGNEMYRGGACYDIDISQLPENIKMIRVRVCCH